MVTIPTGDYESLIDQHESSTGDHKSLTGNHLRIIVCYDNLTCYQ
jgi:hypothetical protein